MQFTIYGYFRFTGWFVFGGFGAGRFALVGWVEFRVRSFGLVIILSNRVKKSRCMCFGYNCWVWGCFTRIRKLRVLTACVVGTVNYSVVTWV